MAKKWKAYTWPNRVQSDDDLKESVDSVDKSETLKISPVVTSIPTKTIVSNKKILTAVNNDDDEEIDVVGVGTSVIIANTNSKISSDQQQNGKSKVPTSTCWGPSSPTEGTTAPSPPPHLPEAATRDSTTLYNGRYT